MKLKFEHWVAAVMYVVTWLAVNMALSTAFAMERASGGILIDEAFSLVSGVTLSGFAIMTIVALTRYKPLRLLGFIAAIGIQAISLSRALVLPPGDMVALTNWMLAWIGTALLGVLIYLLVDAPLEWPEPEV